MKKIKTVYKIDRQTNLATDELTRGAEWVVAGEGIATLKIDGSACLYQDGTLYKRYDRKLKSQFVKEARRLGSDFTPTPDMFNALPDNAIACQENPDPVTYHHPHWVAVDASRPEDSFHVMALANVKNLKSLTNGTYEIIGPKINNNPQNVAEYQLVKHGSQVLDIQDRSFEGMKEFLENLSGEGVVFHHESGEMFKLRRKDYGFFWNHEDTRNLKKKPKI